MNKVQAIVICFIIFLSSCAPAAQQQGVQIELPKKEQVQTVQEKEPIPAPQSVKVIPLLEIELSSSKSVAELKLDTTLTCKPQGGVPPYSINWWVNAKQYPSCKDTEQCRLSIDKIGRIDVACEITDQQQNKTSRQLQMQVTKQKIQVDNILTFGDSLTYGHGLQNPAEEAWPAVFAKNYGSAQLHNYAVSGDTSWGVTEQHLKFNQTIVNQTKNQNNLIFIWVGANDIHRFVPKEQYESNLRKVIDGLKQMPNSKIMLISIPDASKLAITEQVDQGVNQILGQLGVQGQIQVTQITKDIVEQYNQIVFKVAKEEGVPVIDMFSIMEKFDNSLISEDFFHPNARGQERIAKEVQDFIEKEYPKQEFY